MNNLKVTSKKYFLIVTFVLLSLIAIVTASTFIDYQESDFNLGTYNWTFYNSSGFIQLNESRLNGTFTSQIFNAGGGSTWNNISWISNAIGELPANQVTETSFGSGNANMTGNVLLMHFNNDSAYGENDTHVYDFSGSGNNGSGINFDGDEVNLTGGKLNGAFEFDGVNDYIDVGNDTSLNVKDIAVSVWIKPTSVSGLNMIIGKYKVENEKRSWVLRLSDKKVQIRLSADGTANTALLTNDDVVTLNE